MGEGLGLIIRRIGDLRMERETIFRRVMLAISRVWEEINGLKRSITFKQASRAVDRVKDHIVLIFRSIKIIEITHG